MKLKNLILCTAILLPFCSPFAYSNELKPELTWIEKIKEFVLNNNGNDIGNAYGSNGDISENTGPKKPDPEDGQPEG